MGMSSGRCYIPAVPEVWGQQELKQGRLGTQRSTHTAPRTRRGRCARAPPPWPHVGMIKQVESWCREGLTRSRSGGMSGAEAAQAGAWAALLISAQHTLGQAKIGRSVTWQSMKAPQHAAQQAVYSCSKVASPTALVPNRESCNDSCIQARG